MQPTAANGKFRCDTTLERELRARGFHAVAGVDEVGRVPTNDEPPRPTVSELVPPAVHTSAMPPGGGEYTAEMSRVSVVWSLMSPETV